MAADNDRRGLILAILATVLLLALALVLRIVEDDGPAAAAPSPVSPSPDVETVTASTDPSTGPTPEPARIPRIFGEGRFLVAYYGTGGTGALGVLGETDPDTMHRRLVRAAAPFARPARPVKLVYELIVTVADPVPGKDGDYSHDIAPSVVKRYVEAARRHGALLLLDLQTGRSRFVDVARRWEWALREPHVGLALDPEWRMGKDEVPGTVIGSVGAEEVNRTSAWLARVQQRYDLPEKLFVLHQFRSDMIRDIRLVEDRPRLALVQHVDGFGTPSQKRSTYLAVERSRRFNMGFKLFYDEDVNRMSAREVHRLKPAVRFVSFQ